jgi:hypothetical protein
MSSLKKPRERSKEQAGEIVEPRASALIESLRALGYTTKTALADLIDNSIFAGAETVWLDFCWKKNDSYITLRDDGRGMSEEELVEAMRPGTKGPLEERAKNDLGRFGLGMKTASFSQCRRMTVVSVTGVSEQTSRGWDLDYVAETNRWQLLRKPLPSTSDIMHRLPRSVHGTTVIWENLDRVLSSTGCDEEKGYGRFLDLAVQVKEHLAMVFHRYLEEHSLGVVVNGIELQGWDPYIAGKDGAQVLPEEVLPFHGASVVVRPYVLPHESKLSPEAHKAAGGPLGWNAQQGFYVYREGRLLLAGDWLGLGAPGAVGPYRKEEHYKLARISVDFPSSLDEHWGIDVRKATARPPAALRDDFRRIAEATRRRAVEVYRYRGQGTAHDHAPESFVWSEKRKSGKTRYVINRSHPLVVALESEGSSIKVRLSTLLDLIQETLPIPLIVIRSAEQGDLQEAPYEDCTEEAIRKAATVVLAALRESGTSDEQTWKRLAVMEPFNRFPQIIAAIRKNTEGHTR